MNGKYRNYIYWGITALSVIAISIFVGFMFYHFNTIKSGIDKIVYILHPILYGAVLTFLIAPVYNMFYKSVLPLGNKLFKKERFANAFTRMISTAVCVALVLAIVMSMIWMLLPRLIASISEMINTLPASVNKLYIKMEDLFVSNPMLEEFVRINYSKLNQQFSSWAQKSFLPNINRYLLEFSFGILSVVKVFFNFIVGIIVMVYLLNIKKSLEAQGKKIIYAILPLRFANALVEECRYVKTVFSKFIVGKLIDSIIIGVINYIAMNIFSMPYALLISVVIGFTNVVPYFGPFIGAIPSALIILLISPIQCLQFLVWILILQQVDGNIIGPRILGQTIGLSSFWVLFSIILFGGMFGVVGMIIGVPTWAVLYRFIANISKASLKKKKLSVESADYMDLERIDEENKKYIKN